MSQQLEVVDSRTGKSYTIPIQGGNYIRAADIGQILAPGSPAVNDSEKSVDSQITQSLRILDNGFQHTACMESSITYMYAFVPGSKVPC